MGSSLYEKLSRWAWFKGDFKLPEWSQGPAMEETEGAKEKVQAQMERIVLNEAEPAAGADSSARKEGPMKLNKFVKFREEKFGGVLFETRSEKVYTLNPTAAAVVREIVAGTDNIPSKIVNRFDGTPEAIKAEVEAFLSDLKTKGLVTE